MPVILNPHERSRMVNRIQSLPRRSHARLRLEGKLQQALHDELALEFPRVRRAPKPDFAFTEFAYHAMVSLVVLAGSLAAIGLALAVWFAIWVGTPS